MAEEQAEARFLSKPIETLIDDSISGCDVLIIGSGYGGSVAAAELVKPLEGVTSDDRTVFMFERGREYLTGEFPESIEEAPGHMQYWRDNNKQAVGKPDGLFDIRVENDCAVLVGCGLGGGSLINAGVVVEPPDDIFLSTSQWPLELAKDGDQPKLKDYFPKVERLLGAKPFPDAENKPKFKALKRIGDALGAEAKPAPIAVTTDAGHDRLNAMGVKQSECVECGNCVTGCNYQAKNTLAFNFLPFAVSHGLQCFTGVTVVRLMHLDKPTSGDRHGRPRQWRVFYVRTAIIKNQALFEEHCIDACQVILSAGTLGSTEILLRSQGAGLELSKRLGYGVSGNGGFLGFGFGQSKPVKGVATLAAQAVDGSPFEKIGPTILGSLTITNKEDSTQSFSLQDGAIPYSLTPFMNTLGTSLALPHLYFRNRPPAYLEDRAASANPPDPIALHTNALQHMQVLLGASQDDANGCMDLREVKDSSLKRVRISMPFAGVDCNGASRIHKHLKQIDKQGYAFSSGGFDGGYYLPNPLWKLLPEAADAAVGSIKSRVISVHPLGGCVMGWDCRCGVVNHLGQVYDPFATGLTGTYEGLRVLDGSIIPSSIGANPMLTISALAMRSAEQLRHELDCVEKILPVDHNEQYVTRNTHSHPSDVISLPVTAEEKPDISFTEVLYSYPRVRYDTTSPADRGGTNKERFFGASDALELLAVQALARSESNNSPLPEVLAYDIFADSTEEDQAGGAPSLNEKERQKAAKNLVEKLQGDNPGIGIALRLNPAVSVDDWLADPTIAWSGTAELGIWDFGDPARRQHQQTGFWADGDTDPHKSIENFGATLLKLASTGTATVRLLQRNEIEHPEEFSERVDSALEAFTDRRPEQKGDLRGSKSEISAADFHRAAGIHSDWRELVYEAEFTCGDGQHNITINACGSKHLAYSAIAKQLWSTLTEISMTFKISRPGERSVSFTVPMAVDIPELFRNNLLQFSGAQSTLQVINKLIDVGGLWLRAVIGTHYWSFRGTSYEACPRLPKQGDSLPKPFTGFGSDVLPDDCEASQSKCIQEYWLYIDRSEKQKPNLFTPEPDQYRCSGAAIEHIRPDRKPAKSRLKIRMTRYSRVSPLSEKTHQTRPVLLIHGLSHGGAVFTTNTIDCSLVKYLLNSRNVVWVLDHRLSNYLPEACIQPGDIDDIARHDIPAALEMVYLVEGDKGLPNTEIDCFAHCIGSAAFSMAALAGYLENSHERQIRAALTVLSNRETVPIAQPQSETANKPKIASAVLHAFHPFVVPSRWNRNSAAIAAFTKNLLGEEIITPIPPAESTLKDQIIDRIGASVEWEHADDSRHFEMASSERHQDSFGHKICNRMTFYYGREWVHENLNEETIRELHTLLGPAHLDFFVHAFHMARRERLTTAEAENKYLTEKNIQEHWNFNTLFATGQENEVFDPRSAVRSLQAFSKARDKAAPDKPKVKLATYRVAGTGHMDFVFGKHAANDNGIFDHCEKFLSQPEAYVSDFDENLESEQDPYRETTPLAGPIVQYDLLKIADNEPRQFNLQYNASWLTARAWFELRPYGREKLRPVIELSDRSGLSGLEFNLSKNSISTTKSFGDLKLKTAESIKLERTGRYIEALFANPKLGSEYKSQLPDALNQPPDALQIQVAPYFNWLMKLLGLNEKAIQQALNTLLTNESVSDSGIGLFLSKRAYRNNETRDLNENVKELNNLFNESSNQFTDAERKASFSKALNTLIAGKRADGNLRPEFISQILFLLLATNEFLSGNFIHLKMSLKEEWAKRLPLILNRASGKVVDGCPSRIRILLGSCRWPGLFAETKEYDSLLEAMHEEVCKGVDGLWLLGDNIYSDARANLVDTRETAERAADRYRAAFVGDARNDQVYHSPRMAEILRKTPTWMVIDDHELEDNWPGRPGADRPYNDPCDDSSGNQVREPGQPVDDPDINVRANAAYAYQWRRQADSDGDNPQPAPEAVNRDNRTIRGFWQEISTAGLICFAMDTRVERQWHSDKHWKDRTLIGSDQMSALEKWFRANKESEEPMFLLSGSPFGLVRREEHANPAAAARLDDWTGYPETMKWLLKQVVHHKLRNLYIVSGDLHFSCEVKVDVKMGGETYCINSIICSGLNSSLPFANAKPRDFLSGVEIPNTRCQHEAETITTSTTFNAKNTALRQFGVLEVIPASWSTADSGGIKSGEAKFSIRFEPMSLASGPAHAACKKKQGEKQ